MKTSIAKISLITIVLTLVSFAANAEDFFFERKYENDLQVSKIKYQLDYRGGFVPTEKYDYSYDAENRVVKEEMSTWNEKTKSWQPCNIASYSYTSTHYTIEKRTWNKKTKSYSDVTEKMEYTLNNNKDTSYLSIR